ncbi:SRPBCC domain-containing protein [Streptomyces halobius]|uniref:SRPBCC domain-containing protein n=1 Tax=Streptomyces halobius TaxID=2879846 RepID=A0ABY4M0S6_9ACTN|nr:SRPBCC domain-containing protein [Streptomyces halobius]UQA90733.1 SRPBCC domain-containing protein [Streptomyces halobius]
MEHESVQAAVELPLDRPASFELFTSGFDRWWPRDFSWSGPDGLTCIGIECQSEGALYEIGPHGLRWDWGRVLDWSPQSGLVFSWQIGPDRVPIPRVEQATEVAVTFTEQAAGTLVEVHHHGWERHGDLGAGYRQDFTYAWPTALAALRGVATKG